MDAHEEMIRGRHSSFEVAAHELNDIELSARFGPVIDRFLTDLRTDPSLYARILDATAFVRPPQGRD